MTEQEPEEPLPPEEPEPEPEPPVDIQVSKTVPVANLRYSTIRTAMEENEVPEDAFVFTNNGSPTYSPPRPYNSTFPYSVTFAWVE